MIEESQIKNKMIGKEQVKTKDSNSKIEEVFFFPDYQLSITATSREEAQNKLQAIIKKDK